MHGDERDREMAFYIWFLSRMHTAHAYACASACACMRALRASCSCVRVRVSAFLLGFYLSTPRAAGRAHIKMLRLAGCSACGWLTNGKGDAREKEVA